MEANTALNLNLLLRGGAIGLLVLIAITLWRDYPRAVVARIGGAFAISVAAATLASMPGFEAAPHSGRLVVAALASGSMFLFWIFTCALFNDAFSLRVWHAMVWTVLAAFGVMNCIGTLPLYTGWALVLGLVQGFMPGAWALLAIAQSLASWREDLIEPRRQLRTLIVATTSLYTVAQLLAAPLSGLTLRAVMESPANAAGTLALTLFVAWRLLRTGHSDLFGATEPITDITGHLTARDQLPVHESHPACPDLDSRQVAALETLMKVDHVYREPDLTIGALAERMALPERKLRQLINQGLGYRNFSAFLNTYRLADAKRWLADREQAGTPILTVAMDAGFQSLGPFNRAFKADTGVTPGEFRRLSGSAPVTKSPMNLAESGIG